jgi:hypothetical protein
MTIRNVLTAVVIAMGVPMLAGVASAQSTAGATVAQGQTRAMGRPFSGRLSTTTTRDGPSQTQLGMLYAVLDGKGKLAINGTFDKLPAAVTGASFHRGSDGQRGPKVGDLTVTKDATGVIKGDIVLSEADIAELQKGSFYVEMTTEKGANHEIRGWLLPGMLK